MRHKKSEGKSTNVESERNRFSCHGMMEQYGIMNDNIYLSSEIIKNSFHAYILLFRSCTLIHMIRLTNIDTPHHVRIQNIDIHKHMQIVLSKSLLARVFSIKMISFDDDNFPQSLDLIMKHKVIGN
jgi:hypothetical protein